MKYSRIFVLENNTLQIGSVQLLNFRNFSLDKFHFSPNWNLITGRNGQGKTNLLEAIHFCSLGYSHRTRNNREMVKWGEDAFSLRLECEAIEKCNNLIISTHISHLNQNSIQINEMKSHRLADLLGKINVMLFCPEDISIVNGGPAVRRMFMDSQLCQTDRAYLADLRKYHRVLKQRNTVLKESQNFPDDILNILDSQIVDLGTKVIEKRKYYIDVLQTKMIEYFRSIATDEISIQILYQPSPRLNWDNKRSIKDQYRDLLILQRNRESFFKMTEIGPHRDNLLFLLGGKLAEKFGSQGQKRLIALCLKLAAADVLFRVFNHPPILLLDDVFAELDGKRRSCLGEIIGNKGQVLAASPRIEDIPFKASKVLNICTDSVNNGKTK